jgi:hypothetical protein
LIGFEVDNNPILSLSELKNSKLEQEQIANLTELNEQKQKQVNGGLIGAETGPIGSLGQSANNAGYTGSFKPKQVLSNAAISSGVGGAGGYLASGGSLTGAGLAKD